MTEQYATPLVRKLAAQYDVDLSTITGTGVGGRVRPADVQAAAIANRVDPGARDLARQTGIPDSEVLALSVTSKSGRVAETDVSALAARKMLTELRPAAGAPTDTGAYAVNPLVAKARTERPLTYRAATEEGPIPTLFASGDLPVYMVSGADPSLLLKLPWQARHAAARATPAELADIFESYAGPDAALNAEFDYAGHHENRAYETRVQQWLAGPNNWDDPNGNQFAPRSAARQAADAENYEALYGEEDRRKAQAKADLEEDRRAQAQFRAQEQARMAARRQRR